MNEFKVLANSVFVNEFDSDTDMATLTQISGWFENNIGELNTVQPDPPLTVNLPPPPDAPDCDPPPPPADAI